MTKKAIVYGIVAIGPNNIIGCGTHMPWHSKQDLYHFKQTTMGWPCIFGKNTYEHLPIKPLPGRLNIVCSSSYKFEKFDNVIRVPSLEEGLKQCGNMERVFICGGAVLYDYALSHDLIDVMYVTRIHLLDDARQKQITDNPQSNTYFPYKFDWRKWSLYSNRYASGQLPKENPGVKAFFYKYVRIR